MQSPPISHAEIDARIHPHIDELLALWWAEQGASKPNDLALIASVIPFPARPTDSRARSLLRPRRCGPRHSQGLPERTRRRHRSRSVLHVDLQSGESARTYSGKAGRERSAARWLAGCIVRQLRRRRDGERAALVRYRAGGATRWGCASDIARRRRLPARRARGGGTIVCGRVRRVEGEAAAALLARKLATVLVESQRLLGYDHVALWGPRDDTRIGDEMTVAGWSQHLERAGFDAVDVLLRDADQVVIAAMKANDA